MATIINTIRDPNTLANYNNWLTTHTTTNFTLLFEQGKLEGTVVHKLKSITDADTTEIILDTRYLDVKDVKVNGSAVQWKVLPWVDPYGSPLKIQLDKGVPLDETIDLSIDVATTEKCTALQWMAPAQTPNKKYPYMFSQCQAIHCRSIFPCQDTPDVKSTFDFNIKSYLPVIASGLPSEENPTEPSPNGELQLYKYHQPIPMPSYLYALASGDVKAAPIGKHSSVVTGPDELKLCQWELEADMDRFVEQAEKLLIPYVWGQYNVLVLPPSFPYGGMENPNYTFATPTIISGDRENADVIAHELTHSWSGNLVTNSSWEHFWLNEGWTNYIERRIIAGIHNDFAWRDFSAIIGWKALTDEIKNFGPTHNFTRLIPDLKGADPDDAFSSIPYEKGSTFIWYIEKLIGIENFDRFIPHYFKTWQRKSLDSYDFKNTLLDFFSDDKEISTKLNGIDWDTWFYAPGFPPKPDFNTSLVDVCYTLAEKWKTLTAPSTGGGASFAPKAEDINGWAANQVVVFLESVLLFPHPLPVEAARAMGDVYHLADSNNVEVSSRYLQIAMQSGDTGVMDRVADLLGKVGRMKFVKPLFRGLMKLNLEFAQKVFKKNESFYHPICREIIKKLLSGKESKA